MQFDIGQDNIDLMPDDEEAFFVNGEDAHLYPGRHSGYIRPSMQDVQESSSDSEAEDPEIAFFRKTGKRLICFSLYRNLAC